MAPITDFHRVRCALPASPDNNLKPLRPNGKDFTRLSLETTQRYHQDSEWKEKTQWNDCVIFGALSQANASLATGAHLLIEGELTYRKFDRTFKADTGPVIVQWPVTEIIVESFKLLNCKNRDNSDSKDTA